METETHTSEHIQTIGREYTLAELARIAAPPILSQMAMSLLQTMDDGLFISRYIGPEALAAFSICFPVIMLVNALSSALNGAVTLCASEMGEQRLEKAKGDFTAVSLLCVGIGLLFSLLLFAFRDPLLRLLGATDLLMPYCAVFLGISLWYMPLNLLTALFSGFYISAGSPRLSMATTLINAFCNIFFDWLFVVKLGMGMRGVAFADLSGLLVLTVIGLVFFSSKKAEIGFGRPSGHPFRLLGEVFRIGFPHMVTHLALSINSIVGNLVILDVEGEVGVSASTIVNNIQFLFMSAYFGLFSATSPIISYAYGEKNGPKLKRIFRQAITLVAVLSVLIILLYLVGKGPLMAIYVPETTDDPAETARMVELSLQGLRIAPLIFVFFGFVVFGEDFFAAVQNPKAATLLTTCENVLFANLYTILLPELFGMLGFWLSFPVCEISTFFIALLLTRKYRDVYGYGKTGKATAFES